MMIFDEAYFMGDNVAEPNPAGYSNYERDSYTNETAVARAERIISICQETGLVINTALVIGCAYGYLVKAFTNLGVQAYGLDISPFAINESIRLGITDKVILGDACSSESYAVLPVHFDVIIEEDMLCCLTDEEAVRLCNVARFKTDFFLHLLREAPGRAEYYNYHDIDDWKNKIGTYENERWFTLYDWEEK